MLGGLGAVAGLVLPVPAVGAAGVAAVVLTTVPGRFRRGAGRVEAALRALDSEPARAAAQLAALSRSRSVDPALRAAAAGHVAALALDTGDLDRAVDAVRRFGNQGEPPALGLGLFAELMRGILLRLGVPNIESRASIDELVPRRCTAAGQRQRDRYRALLALCAVIDARTSASDSRLASSWRRMRATSLASLFPGLAFIADAAAADRVPAAATAFEQSWAKKGGRGPLCACVERLFPSVEQRVGGRGYRVEAGTALEPADPALHRAPNEVRALASSGTRGRAARGLWFAARAAAPGLAGLALAAGSGGAAVGLGLAGAVSVWQHRNLRVRAIARMPRGPTSAWLREMAQAPDAPLGDRNAPLRPEQIELYIACVRAEQALARADAQGAWSQLAWWFEDRDYRRPPSLSVEPVASTLLRVAALADRQGHARSLAHAMRPGGAPRLRYPMTLRRRTVFGDAPAALGYARAMVFARANAWSEAARALEGVASARPVVRTERDEVLHALVAQRIQGIVKQVDPRLCMVSPRAITRVRPWLHRVWAQLLPRQDT